MEDNVIVKTLQNLAGYFVIALGGTWIVEKILGPSKEILGVSPLQMLIGQGSFFRALILAACLYFVYFVAAAAISSEGNSGKFVVGVIALYLLGSLVHDLIEVTAHDKDVLDHFINVSVYLIVMLENVLHMFATFHGFAEGNK